MTSTPPLTDAALIAWVKKQADYHRSEAIKAGQREFGRFTAESHYADVARFDAIAARLEQGGKLREFVEGLANRALCGDPGEGAKCSLDSGPYCGHHIYDQWLIEDARAVLPAPPATSERQ